jgi:hypothetical protein
LRGGDVVPSVEGEGGDDVYFVSQLIVISGIYREENYNFDQKKAPIGIEL